MITLCPTSFTSFPRSPLSRCPRWWSVLPLCLGVLHLVVLPWRHFSRHLPTANSRVFRAHVRTPRASIVRVWDIMPSAKSFPLSFPLLECCAGGRLRMCGHLYVCRFQAAFCTSADRSVAADDAAGSVHWSAGNVVVVGWPTAYWLASFCSLDACCELAEGGRLLWLSSGVGQVVGPL